MTTLTIMTKGITGNMEILTNNTLAGIKHLLNVGSKFYVVDYAPFIPQTIIRKIRKDISAKSLYKMINA